MVILYHAYWVWHKTKQRMSPALNTLEVFCSHFLKVAVISDRGRNPEDSGLKKVNIVEMNPLFWFIQLLLASAQNLARCSPDPISSLVHSQTVFVRLFKYEPWDWFWTMEYGHPYIYTSSRPGPLNFPQNFPFDHRVAGCRRWSSGFQGSENI